MSTSNQTHDHQIIQEWVEKRKGVPTRVKGTGKADDDGLLRIHFPENSKSDNFEEMEWDDFFSDFEKNKLDFLYQDKKADGETSTFHKFVERK
jgi:hypothetical protein